MDMDMDMAPISASNAHCLLDDKSSENPTESKVSLEFSLYDKTWPHDPNVAPWPIDNNKPTEEKINLARMRFMSNEERKREERYSVSTELSLVPDPWIKKKMTKSSLGNLNRLLLNGSFVHSHILSCLPLDAQRMVEEGPGLTVNVYDEDTDSTHELLLRKWPTYVSYVLLNGWREYFVERRALQIGDVIGIYWNRLDSNLHFCVLSRAPAEVISGSVTMDLASSTPFPAGP